MEIDQAQMPVWALNSVRSARHTDHVIGVCPMQPPIQSAPDIPAECRTARTDQQWQDDHRRASFQRTLSLYRALDRLRFYQRFLYEISREWRSLFVRIAALRKNSLFRCGIVPLTTWAQSPNKHQLSHIHRHGRNQCMRSFYSIHPAASLGDLRLLLEGWERGVEYSDKHYRNLHNLCQDLSFEDSGKSSSEQRSESTPRHHVL